MQSLTCSQIQNYENMEFRDETMRPAVYSSRKYQHFLQSQTSNESATILQSQHIKFQNPCRNTRRQSQSQVKILQSKNLAKIHAYNKSKKIF